MPRVRSLAVGASALVLGIAAAFALTSESTSSTSDQAIFCSEFLPNEQASWAPGRVLAKWARDNPGERDAWLSFANLICAGQSPQPPTVSTLHGLAIVAAGKEALPEIPPPTTTSSSSETTTAPTTTETTTTTEPPPTTLPFAEADLRSGFVTLTVPASSQNVSCPAGLDCLIDLQGITRTVGSLLIWGSSGQRIRVVNGHWKIDRTDLASSPYWRGGPRVRSTDTSGVTGPEHVSLTGMLIEGSTLADAIAIDAGNQTKVTIQRTRVEYPLTNRAEPAEHLDAVQVQGEIGRLEIGRATFQAAPVAYPNDGGKCFMLKREGNGGPFSVDLRHVNCYAGPARTGTLLYQESRDIRVDLDDAWALKETGTEGCATWASGNCLFYPNASVGSSVSWFSTGTAPNRTADWPDAAGIYGVIREGRSSTGQDFVTRADVGG